MTTKRFDISRFELNDTSPLTINDFNLITPLISTFLLRETSPLTTKRSEISTFLLNDTSPSPSSLFNFNCPLISTFLLKDASLLNVVFEKVDKPNTFKLLLISIFVFILTSP